MGMVCCSDCKFYKPVDKENGTCFGFMAKADDDAKKCPVELYEPND